MFGDIDIYPKLVEVDFLEFLMTLVGIPPGKNRWRLTPKYILVYHGPLLFATFWQWLANIGLQSVPTTGILHRN